MRKSVLRLAGWRAASWAETAAVPRVAGAMAKREVAKARGRATAAEEGALAALTEATQSSPLVHARVLQVRLPTRRAGPLRFYVSCREECPKP